VLSRMSVPPTTIMISELAMSLVDNETIATSVWHTTSMRRLLPVINEHSECVSADLIVASARLKGITEIICALRTGDAVNTREYFQSRGEAHGVNMDLVPS